MYQIHNCSDRANVFIDPLIVRDPRPLIETKTQADKYPFKRMQVGHCFVIPFADLNNKFSHSAIYSAVSKANKRLLGKRFKLLRHDDWVCFEIARIA